MLTTILRTYEGAFDYPAFISESLLARLLNKDEKTIRSELKLAASFDVISYMPQNESPQIIFRKHRVPSSELQFNLKPYNKRKNLFIERVTAMIGYTKTNSCRSKYISNYFGDFEARDCGCCDECLQRKASPLGVEEFEKIKILITQQLTQRKMTASELLEQIRNIKKENAWKVIEFMQAEETIVADQVGMLRLKEGS